MGISTKTVEQDKPLEAFALMKRGIPKTDPDYAKEMQGARLAREIDSEFENLSAHPG